MTKQGGDGRGEGGKFARGNPGGGRPAGRRNSITLAVEALLEGDHEKLTRKAIEKALEGDSVALRMCLDRLSPPRKDAAISFELPPIKEAQDMVEASSAVVAAVASGEITPDEGGRVMAIITAHRGVIEACDLERRVRELEERTAKK